MLLDILNIMLSISSQTIVILSMISISLSSLAAGVLLGMRYQRMKSDEETKLLVSIWEKLLAMNEEINFLLRSFELDETADMPVIDDTHVFATSKTQILDLEKTAIIDTSKKKRD